MTLPKLTFHLLTLGMEALLRGTDGGDSNTGSLTQIMFLSASPGLFSFLLPTSSQHTFVIHHVPVQEYDWVVGHCTEPWEQQGSDMVKVRPIPVSMEFTAYGGWGTERESNVRDKMRIQGCYSSFLARTLTFTCVEFCQEGKLSET